MAASQRLELRAELQRAAEAAAAAASAVSAMTPGGSGAEKAAADGRLRLDPAVMAWLKGRIDNAFGIVERHLANRAFLVGESPTIADFSLCGYPFYPVEESGYEVAGRFPQIQAWLERMRVLPGWASPYDVMPGERTAPRW